jgi:hypothetical protein
MKQSIILAGCCIILTGLAGCQEQSGKLFEGGRTVLPPDIAGTWIARGSPWKIVLSPQGKVTSAVIPLGEVEVKPNQTTKVPGPKGEPGFYEAGNFTVDYNPQGRELAVNIKIKQFYLERVLEWNVISKGSWEYFIVGDVLEDGKTWQADVFNSLDIAVLAPDPNQITDKSKFKETARLRINLGDEEGENLIFTKVPDGNAGSNK